MMHVGNTQAEPLPTITSMVVKAAVVRGQEMKEKLEASEQAGDKESDSTADSKSEASTQSDDVTVSRADSGLGKAVDVLA